MNEMENYESGLAGQALWEARIVVKSITFDWEAETR